MKLIFILLMLTLDGIGKVNRNLLELARPRGLQSPFMMRYEWLLKVNK